jgi:hypothetical protein
MDMSERNEVFEDEVMDKHCCHFKIRICDGAVWVLKGEEVVADVFRPLQPPDNRIQM